MNASTPAGAARPARPRILCVDDETQVLDGLEALLRRRFEVVTAASGADGLQRLQEMPGRIAVIVSDMRMPRMDGAQFLRQACAIAPDASRILLTGQAEMSAAIAAINEGQIFRFLTKPCPPDSLIAAIDAGVAQHRLQHSEKELLEGTLQGAIRALTEVLSLNSPVAFGRAGRVKRKALDLAENLGIGRPWELDVAAMLMELGSTTLPTPLQEKHFHGGELSVAEKRRLAGARAATVRLLANIPRLEVVRATLSLLLEGQWPTDLHLSEADTAFSRRLAGILLVAGDHDALEASGSSPRLAVEIMQGRPGRYHGEVLEALTQMCAGGARLGQVHEVPLAALEPGMIIADDVRLSTGAMLVPRGFEVTQHMVERLRHLNENAIRGKLRVYRPQQAA